MTLHTNPRPVGLEGPVHIIGAGLIGTSIGLALSRIGVEALLTDRSPGHLRTALALGAGRAASPADLPQLVVVAVPPDHLSEVILEVLDRTTGQDTIVTDVGSIKSAPLAAVIDHPEARRYVGGHPMAGTERSGPLAASVVLFDGRPWALTPHEGTSNHAVELIEDLARRCGAVPVRLEPDDHDRAVAVVSHLPHLMASLTAAGLTGAPAHHLAISGQGVRDVTRVAAGDPDLYGQIIAANAEPVLELLAKVRERLDEMIAAVRAEDRLALRTLLADGVAGTQAIPGKHGGQLAPMRPVFVSLPDEPGGLARLFADASTSMVNIEDVRIDHDPGRAVGLVELLVDEDRAEHLLRELASRGWTTHL